MMRISRLMLVTRSVPKCIKVSSRLPIPKEGKPGDTRPLALMHDLNCVLMASCSKWLQNAKESIGDDSPELVAYKKGKGCDDITLLNIAMKEDAIASGQPLAIVEEDEEKMFDRIPLGLQLVSIMLEGAPSCGYVEMKADSLDGRMVNIICAQGNVKAKQGTGLLQGDMFSMGFPTPVMDCKHTASRLPVLKSSPIIKVNGRIANLPVLMASPLQRGPLAKYDPNLYPYVFSIKDDNDEITKVSGYGYCDDNEFPNGAENALAVAQARMCNTSKFSIVTKLGRRGSKSAIMVINADRSLAKNPPVTSTIAWSFADHAPTEEVVELRLHFKEAEDEDELNDIEDVAKASYNGSDKRLGVYSDMIGDTTRSRDVTIASIGMRMNDVGIYRVKSEKAISMVSNSIITSVASYSPLLSPMDGADLEKVDKMLFKQVATQLRLTSKDSKKLLSVHPSHLGHGVKSFTALRLAGVGRELEIYLNDNTAAGTAMRARLAAAVQGESLTCMNYVRRNINLLASYGIFLRDQNSNMLGRMLDNLAMAKCGRRIIGTPQCNSKGDVLGRGNVILVRYALGGEVEQAIRATIMAHEEEKQIPVTATMLATNTFWNAHKDTKPKGISPAAIAEAASQALADIRSDSKNMLEFWEWRATAQDLDPTTSTNWSLVEAVLSADNTWAQSEVAAATAANHLRTSKLSWDNDNDKQVLELLTKDDQPLIISTDGGYIKAEGELSRIAAAAVLCSCDFGDSIQDDSWLKERCKPVIVRVALLPRRIGNTETDNNQAELLALTLADSLSPVDCPALLITDSSSVREKYMTIRDGTAVSHRALLRKTYSGISKGLTVLLASNIDKWERPAEPNLKLMAMVASLESCISDDPDKRWKRGNWDDDTFRACMKVDSHQLKSDFSKGNRYKLIAPCEMMVTANQLADNAASIGIGKLESDVYQQMAARQPNDLLVGNGLRFYITHARRRLDKDTSKEIMEIAANEMFRRMCTVQSQGLMCRILPYAGVSCNLVGTRGPTRMMLSHRSTSHTRNMYMNRVYREYSAAEVGEFLQTQNKSAPKLINDKDKIDEQYLKCPFCIEITGDNEKAGHGNTHHLHRCCCEPRIKSAREQLLNLVEQALKEFWDVIVELPGRDR